MLRLGEKTFNQQEKAFSFEWLETNGIGGFASGTVAGALTRRYHGLLTAAAKPPLGRITMLSKFEETLWIGSDAFELSANRYPEKIHPQGYEFLKAFQLDPFPKWTYEVNGLRLVKSVFMVHGINSAVCRWQLETPDADARLELRPLVSFTDYHHLQRRDPNFDTTVNLSDGRMSICPYADMPELFLAHNADAATETGHWYFNIELDIERERGFDFHEDLYQPVALSFGLSEPAVVIASTDADTAADYAEIYEKEELRRRKALQKRAGSDSPFTGQLVAAADQFIVKRGKGNTIIAGYPWFSDWGRDTMISLPGLTIATGRLDVARQILAEYARHISQGMIPNRFPDEGDTADYNTVDATLWYIEAVRAYAKASGDEAFVRDEVYEKLADIIAWHVRGTRHNIHVDTDGLLYAGGPGEQLTWMDAKIGDKVITPRTGKPVEIQALWYNALRTMADLAGLFGHDEDRPRFSAMADLAKLSFNGVFWNEAEQCLFDVVENGHRDASVRPNQLLAISLHYPILEEKHWQTVLEKAEKELLTPVGLRSLSPKDPQYIPFYKGSPFDRDSAYHQGTVWGWLIGPFVDAYRRVHTDSEDVGNSEDIEKRIGHLLTGFKEHLKQAGIGQISEIFDAEPPHTPRGCPAQAWSVAEVLRITLSKDLQEK
ncbi:MAG: glycogen debranching enzyme family protein [Acidobacteria bacterium]|nr:glycogen debranching enzyme family protein [Acidobacteriota bacterium]